MRKIILFILLITVGISSSFAHHRTCKKTTVFKMAQVVAQLPVQGAGTDLPAGEQQFCQAGFVLSLPAQPSEAINSYILVTEIYASLSGNFITQFVANPPYSPPRFFV